MTAYTYHLYHEPTGKHYYGVRYAKGCDPTDLWTSYFSSSPVVHQLIEEYGVASFNAKVRRVFESAEQAVEWETKFLTRVRAQKNDLWLNRSNGGSFMGVESHRPESIEKTRKALQGITRSEETKAKIAAKAKQREQARRESGWTMPEDAITRAQETVKRRIEAGEVNPYSAERNAKMAASKKGAKRVYRPDGSFYMSNGD